MDESVILSNQTVEDVFKDFMHRRLGLTKALTSDVEDFSQQCANEKDHLCLYGLPDDKWEVKLPAEEVPPEIPEPIVGINLAKGRMQEKEWLALVAMHSDAWLISVAYYFGGRFGFGKYERKRLFTMINELPTIFEVVTGTAEKQVKEEEHVDIVCGECGQSNAADGFWICCDMCERWFHGPCVEMTPAGVEHIKEYKCPSCSKKRHLNDC